MLSTTTNSTSTSPGGDQLLLGVAPSHKQQTTSTRRIRRIIHPIVLSWMTILFILACSSLPVLSLHQTILPDNNSIKSVPDACPLGFKQANITQYWTDSTGPCLICGERFKCSERWNNSFENPFYSQKEEEEQNSSSSIRVWQVKGALFYQFDVCEDSDSLTTSRNVSIALNEVNIGSLLLTAGCNCEQCEMTEYMFHGGLMNWSPMTHFQLVYSDPTIQLCISRAVIQFCYVDTDVKVADIEIQNDHKYQSPILMSSIGGSSFYLKQLIVNKGPDDATGLVKFQQSLQLTKGRSFNDLSPFTFNHLSILTSNGSLVSEKEHLLFQSSCSITTHSNLEIQLSCDMNLDQFSSFQTSVGPMFYIVMNVTLHNAPFVGSAHIKSTIYTLNSDTIDPISSNNEQSYQINAYSKSQKYLLIGEAEKHIGYFNENSSDEFIISSANAPNGDVIILNIYMDTPVSIIVQITSSVQNFSVGVSETSFRVDSSETQYFFAVTLLDTTVLQDENHNFTITLHPQDAANLTQVQIRCLSTKMSSLSIDDSHPVERMQFKYDWSFFKISGTSPTTTINALIDSAAMEPFTNTLRIYVSNSFVSVWNEESASELRASEQPYQWLFKNIGNQDQDYYLAVYGEACPLRCVFNTRMFLTDDNLIKLDPDHPATTLEFKDQSPLVIHYLYKIDLSAWGDPSRSLKQDDDSRKQYVLRIHISLSGNREEASYLSTYIRENEYPTEQVYDQSRSTNCDELEESLVLSVDEMADNQWYFGYTFCCGTYKNATITVSLQAPLEYSDEITPLDIPTIPLYRNTEFFSLNISTEEESEIPPHFLSNVTLLHLDMIDNLTIYSKMDSIPTIDDYDSMIFIQGGRSYVTLLTDITFFTSERAIMNQFYGSNKVFTTDTTTGSKLYFRFEVEQGANWCEAKTDSKMVDIRFSSTTSSLKRLTIGNTERGTLGAPSIEVNDWEEETVSPSVLTAPSQFFTFSLNNLYYQHSKMMGTPHSTTTVQIECIVWDVPAVNKSLVESLWNNTSVIADFEEYPVPGYSSFVFKRSRSEYLMKNQVYTSIKFTLTVPLTDLLGTSLQAPGSLGGTNNTALIIGIYSADPFSIHSSNSILSYEIASHFVQNVIIPLESTKLPTTTWSVIGVGILYVVVTIIIMFAFSLKFYEKLVRQELTTFDSLSDNDLVCFPCAFWFSLFGEKASRRAKQLLILVPALILLGFGIIMAFIFGGLSASASQEINCCQQRGDTAFRRDLKSVQEDVYMLYFEYNGPPTFCFSGSESPFRDINKDYTKRKRVAAFSAQLLCFRGSHQIVVLRGNDSFGTVGTLTAGLSFIVSSTLIMALLIELFLSTWYCERTFGPRLLYHLTNE